MLVDSLTCGMQIPQASISVQYMLPAYLSFRSHHDCMIVTASKYLCSDNVYMVA